MYCNCTVWKSDVPNLYKWSACEISSTSKVSDYSDLQRPSLMIHHIFTQPHYKRLNGALHYLSNNSISASLSTTGPENEVTEHGRYRFWSSISAMEIIMFRSSIIKSPGQMFCLLRKKIWGEFMHFSFIHKNL